MYVQYSRYVLRLLLSQETEEELCKYDSRNGGKTIQFAIALGKENKSCDPLEAAEKLDFAHLPIPLTRSNFTYNSTIIPRKLLSQISIAP